MTGGTVGFLVFVIVIPLLVNEAGDVAPCLARCLLRWGARRIGQPGQAKRYEEEWLADLERVPGKVTKLAHACGVVMTSVPRLRAQFRRGRHRSRLSGALPGRTVTRLSEQLAGGQDLGATLRQAGEMLVPQFADHCLIDLFDGDLLIRRMQRHTSSWTPPPGTWTQVGEQIQLPQGHFAQQAIERLGTILAADLAEGHFPAPSAPSKAIAREIGVTSAIAAPLYAHGVLLGVMSVALSGLTNRADRHYTTADRDLITAIAPQVAIAIDNATLFKIHQTVLTSRHPRHRRRPHDFPVPG